MRYEEHGIEKSWELIRAHDSVSVLIYNADRDAFVLVRQFRPAVFLANRDGYSYELCAGILDKELSLEEVAQEEIAEETGYRVELERIVKVSAFYTSVGFAGSRQTLYYAQVGDRDQTGQGGGVDAEHIEVIHLPVAEAHTFLFDETKVKTPGLMFAFLWFFEHKPQQKR